MVGHFLAAQVESISAPELQRLLVEQRGAVVLVDTRTIEERNVSIIPGGHRGMLLASAPGQTSARAYTQHSAQEQYPFLTSRNTAGQA